MSSGLRAESAGAVSSGAMVSLAGRLGRMEAFLGLCVAALLGVLAVCAMPIYRFATDRREVSVAELLLYAAVGLPLAVPAVLSVRFIAEAFRELPEPGPGAIAARQRAWGAVWGPMVATWWLAQFVACVWIAEVSTRGLVMNHPNAQELALTLTLRAGLMLGASFAGNLFLLLAVQAAAGMGRVFRAVRWGRFLIDGAVVAGILAWRNV